MAELQRALSYDQDGQPVMVIFKKKAPVLTFSVEKKTIESYIIEQKDAWMYSRDHYPAKIPIFHGWKKRGLLDVNGNQQTVPDVTERVVSFDYAMRLKANELCYQFELGEATTQRFAQIISLIEDGLGDLIAMPPQKTEDKVFGEIKLSSQGQDFYNDATEEVPITDNVVSG